MNKDQLKGRGDSAKGKVKEKTGKALGNKEMEGKGKAEKAGGKAQATWGDVKSDIKSSTK